MTTRSPRAAGAMPALFACALAMATATAAAAGPAPPEGTEPAAGAPAPATITDADIAADPAAAWARFLRETTLADAYAGYDVLPKIGFRGGSVDPDGCREHADALAAAVAAAPVSIAMRHAAMLCADATGDAAAAEREMAVVAALSRFALAQASDFRYDRPIRVLAPLEAYALLNATGLGFAYEYFEQRHPLRDFPLHVAAWDAEREQEVHLRFDFVDAANALLRGEPQSGFPVQRQSLADQFVNGLRDAGEGVAVDVLAVREAARMGAGPAKRDVLAAAARRGGILAARAWIGLCVLEPFDGCGDGLVDALLPQAEALHAMPMALLAFAYGEGIGVSRDAAASAALLRAADARWPDAGASVEYVRLWLDVNEGPLPPALEARLADATRAGNPDARMLSLARRAVQAGTVLDAGDLAYLAGPDVNATGQGHAVLAAYHETRGDAAQTAEWIRRAALDGSAWHQAKHASDLLFGDGPEVAPDDPAVRRLLVDAAHGADAWAARRLAFQAMDDGKWQDAVQWLLGPAWRGDIDAMLAYAGLHEEDRPGVPADTKMAIEVYTSLADENDVAEARRRLADMALDGRGMEKDPARARAWLLADAEKGDHASQADLGLALLYGTFGEVDEAGGIRWLEPAVAAGNELALVQYANWLNFTRDTAESRREARALWARAHDAGFLGASNNLAWVLCTSPEPGVPDAARGLEIALAMDEAHELGAGEIDTVAACHAANGDFAAAMREQQRAMDALAAIEVAEDDAESRKNVEETQAGFRERMALYAAGKPFVEVDG